jgi:acyl dehydratase
VNIDVKGRTVVDTELTVDPDRLRLLEEAIGTPTAAMTARLVPFFGPTAAGQDSVIEPLGIDLSKALQGGQAYEWHRPFEPGEKVRMRVRIEDVFDRGDMQIATVVAEYESIDGEPIQRQQTIFIERG